MAYIEVLAHERKPTAIGLLSRAVAWFNGQGMDCRRVMSDSGPAYDSKAFAQACRAMELRRIRTRALHTPHQRQGKTGWPPAYSVHIQTLCREWA